MANFKLVTLQNLQQNDEDIDWKGSFICQQNNLKKLENPSSKEDITYFNISNFTNTTV